MLFSRCGIHSLFKSSLLAALGAGFANGVLATGPIPTSLKGVPVPEVPGLLTGPSPIVVDLEKALVLGKALFWDRNVGSDGMACASCHFHAGADPRVKNQFTPSGPGSTSGFDPGTDGAPRGPNYTLRRSDFPLTQSNSPTVKTELAGFLRESDDVVGSAGTFGGSFKTAPVLKQASDDCVRSPGTVFHVGGTGTRRVVDRNAPSVINAVFNYRNFWDGRASNVFNGSSPWGERDADAGVWVQLFKGKVYKLRMRLTNSALASQAVAPIVNSTEMTCDGRTLANLGRKLIWRRPLENQRVHPTDSVLGPYSRSTNENLQAGLNTYYMFLVQQAFNPIFWSSRERGPFGAPKPATGNDVPLPYNQLEANFGMFFGVALQLYQSTLVSDDSPFDRSRRDDEGVPVDLSASQIRGFEQFREGHCNRCHLGPLLTSAALETNARLVKEDPLAFGDQTQILSVTRNVVTRTAVFKGAGIIDTGFAATGVGQDDWDPGLAGKDAFGNPLSLADQYLRYLTGDRAAVLDSAVRGVRPCDLQVPIALNMVATHSEFFTLADGIQPQSQNTGGCFSLAGAFLPTPAAAAAELANPATRKMLAVTDSAFKIPTLRNVELTGPYMHNGSMATLEEVVEFYARGGNFQGRSKQFGTVFPQAELQLDATARADLVNFMKSLTDDRVRYERAPFDHPELTIPHGHVGDHRQILRTNALGSSLGDDESLVLPAVGAAGRAEPFQPFEAFLAP